MRLSGKEEKTGIKFVFRKWHNNFSPRTNECMTGTKTEIEIVSDTPLIHIIHPGEEEGIIAVTKIPALIGYFCQTYFDSRPNCKWQLNFSVCQKTQRTPIACPASFCDQTMEKPVGTSNINFLTGQTVENSMSIIFHTGCSIKNLPRTNRQRSPSQRNPQKLITVVVIASIPWSILGLKPMFSTITFRTPLLLKCMKYFRYNLAKWVNLAKQKEQWGHLLLFYLFYWRNDDISC